MGTVFRFQYLAVLVMCAYFCTSISEGVVFPCFKNNTEFRNRTLSAALNGSVSFTFCAESNYSVHRRIQISHPNHGDDWYPLPYTLEKNIQVGIVTHHRRTDVTIAVNNLEPADFNETFSVTMFSAANGTRLNDDNTTFFFVIRETDNETTTLPTPLTSTEVMHDLRPTTSSCGGQNDTIRKQNLCPVTYGVCVTVFPGDRNMTVEEQCASNNASHIRNVNFDIVKRCLIDLLRLDLVQTLRVDETRYIDSQNWTEVPPVAAYRIGCLTANQPLADPIITWFTLELADQQRQINIWTYNLLNSNNTHVTVPATIDTVNVTCRASGYPKPEVVNLRDNVTLEMIPAGASLIRSLKGGYSGVITCQAVNAFTSGQTFISVRIYVTDSTSKDSHSPTDNWVAIAVGATVGTVVGITFFAAVVLVGVFFRKKRNHLDIVGRHGTADSDDHDEVVIDNMALYNIGRNTVLIDNMALYNIGNDTVTVDNMTLYNIGKRIEDETDSVNPYEEVKENTRNNESSTVSTSQPQRFNKCSTADTDKVRGHQSNGTTSVDDTYTAVVKVKPGSATPDTEFTYTNLSCLEH